MAKQIFWDALLDHETQERRNPFSTNMRKISMSLSQWKYQDIQSSARRNSGEFKQRKAKGQQAYGLLRAA